MNVLLGQLVNSKSAIEKLVLEKFPIKVSYNLHKNIKLIDAEFRLFEESRTKLITEKYGVQEVDGDGKETGQWKVPDEAILLFSKEMNELMSTEVDIPLLTIKLPDSCEISVADLALLSWMLDFEEPQS